MKKITLILFIWGVMTSVFATQPNVVLVITDDQGYGDLACHGNPIIKTPQIDKLYADSIRLTDFHVSPTCSPTRAALLTGHWSNRTGVWHTIQGRSMLRKNEVTLAEIFTENDYATAMFGKWHLGDNYPFRPQDRGFQEVFCHKAGGMGQTPDYWNNAYFDSTYRHNGKPELVKGFCTDIFFDRAIAFMDEKKESGQPFFAYIASNAPHAPMHAPEKYSAMYPKQNTRVANFYGMITNIDDNVKKLRDYLKAENLEDNTILIFMTDNGSSAGSEVYNAGMQGKKNSEYDGGHRVPFFIHWPAGGLSGGIDMDELSAHVDILPTLLDFCGVKMPKGLKVDGVSLSDLLQKKVKALPSRILVTDSQRVVDPIKWRKSAVMTNRHRLVNGTELYDIKADPGQKNDIASSHPEVVSELRGFYDAWWADLEPGFKVDARIIVGNKAENPTSINAHDWITDGEYPPWNQSHIRGINVAKSGFWNLDIERAGEYELTLRRWPKELKRAITASLPAGDPVPGEKGFREEKGKAFNAIKAAIKIGGQEQKKSLSGSEESISFKLQLNAGKMTLKAWFIDDRGVELGTYYVDVLKLPGMSEASQSRLNMQSDWERMNASKTETREWFNDAKYGMFIHWGLYSIPAGTWKGKRMEELKGPRVAEWIQFGAKIPRDEYAQLAKGFNPTEFDADFIAKLAKDAGMKYLVITAKHHDGFAMYDSAVSEYDIVDATPFKRDVVEELYKACQKYGIDFGLYYSHNIDWMDGHDAQYAQFKNQKIDWRGKKIRPNGANLWDPSPNTFQEYLDDKAFPQVREILTKFPNMKQLWYDYAHFITVEQSYKFYKEAYQLQPQLLVNERVGNHFGDFDIPGDNKIPENPELIKKPWQTVGTLNNSWGYKSYDNDWKSAKELLFWLIEITSKGGNYMLNIGPTGTGVVPEQSVINLRETGEWLKINGEAIYGTEAWIVNHEGPTDLKMGGTKHREQAGGALKFTSEDFWFTKKENVLYAIALEYPSDGIVHLKNISTAMAEGIETISVLGAGEVSHFKMTSMGLEIKLPKKKPNSNGYVIKIEL